MTIVIPSDSIPIIAITSKNGYYKLIQKDVNTEKFIEGKSYSDYFVAEVAGQIFADQNNLPFVNYGESFISIGQVSKETKLYFTVVKVTVSSRKITPMADYDDLATAYIESIKITSTNELTFAPFWLLGKSFQAVQT